MEPMDIDFVVDVPDTPDRQAAGGKGKSIQSGNDDKVRTGLRVNENGSRKSLIQAPRSRRSSLSDHGCTSAAAPGNSFSKNSLPSRRLGSNNVHSYENRHSKSENNDKLQNIVSSVDQEGSVENLTVQNGHSKKGKKVVLRGHLGGSQAVENGTNSPQVIELHSPRSMGDSLVASRINSGTGRFNTLSAFDHGKGVVSSAVIQPNAGGSLSASPDSGSSSSRVIGQKRWVRNGCISPSNIAKVQHIVGNGNNCAVDDEQCHPLSFSSTGSLAGERARVPVVSNVSKGKGVMMHPLSMKESGGQDENNRDTVSINEIIEDVDDDNRGTFRTPGHLGGWRSTRNRSKTTNLTSSKEHHHSSSSSESPPLPPLSQRLHSVRSQLNQHNGDHPVTNMIQKRQKQGSASTIQDDLSGRTFDDSGIIFLGSPGDTIESRPARPRRRNRVDSSNRVIEIDEASSGVRGDGSNGAGSSNSENVMARQIEADERLARELQEQLYSEDLGVRVGEIDAQETLDLPHENLQHGFPRRSRHGFSARNTLTANSSRPPRVRSSVNASRAGPQGASIHSRMDRLRNRFPGRPRTLSSSRERSSMFSSEMDVDLRMSILEALEAFNDMGVDNNLLEINREFNENDYEMLLALDENNHRHSGASTSRINHLPQSTVQNDNFEEACAVCLETPSTGDVIRHLPCLHKFHKDCIDPWLRRKSSCPVCKSSIT